MLLSRKTKDPSVGKKPLLCSQKKEVDEKAEDIINRMDCEFLNKIRKAKKEDTKAFTKKQLHEFIVEKVDAINDTDDCKLSKK